MKKLSLVLVALLAFSFVGCQEWLDIPDPEPEPEPEPEPVEEAMIMLEDTLATLHYGETYQINAECDNPITYSSENEYNATVSEEGLVTANFVGTTTITLASEFDTKTFEVIVEPVSNLYPEPEIEFGVSMDSIIEKFGEPDAEVEGAIAYSNYSENSNMLMVMFDDEDLVQYYAVVFDVEYSDELDTFLSERYLFAQEEDGIKMYINALDVNEATMIVGSQMEDGFLMAMYMANTGDDGDDEDDEDGEEATGRIKALLNSLKK